MLTDLKIPRVDGKEDPNTLFQSQAPFLPNLLRRINYGKKLEEKKPLQVFFPSHPFFWATLASLLTQARGREVQLPPHLMIALVTQSHL